MPKTSKKHGAGRMARSRREKKRGHFFDEARCRPGKRAFFVSTFPVTFFRRFILGRFPGHVFWTFLDHVFWTFYFCTFEDHDCCEKLTHSRTKREKNVTETSRPNSRKCHKHQKTRWITFSGRFIFPPLRITTGAKS